MLSKVTFAAALVMGASAIDAEQYNRGYNAGPISGLLHGGHGGARRVDSYGPSVGGYGNQSYGNPSYGNQSYGNQSYGNQSYGFPWVRRSTIRPRDVKAYNAEPVDNYWKSAPKEDEEIIASCEMDFLGYSHSSGSLELRQKPHDLISIIGEFTGLKPGLHAMKIHEYGDLEYGCESTGGVYNPFGAYRGHSHEDIHDRRVGDVEQIQARFTGDAEYKNRDLLANLSGPNSIIGRSLVVYEREDDHDQTEHEQTHDREGRYRENEGRRIGCCVVGLAKAEKPKPENPSKPIFPAKAEP
jgi:Cu-Zn family superoxide dismutase